MLAGRPAVASSKLVIGAVLAALLGRVVLESTTLGKGWRYGLLIGSIRSDRICLNICGVSTGSIWLKTSSIRFDMPSVKFWEIILDHCVL